MILFWFCWVLSHQFCDLRLTQILNLIWVHTSVGIVQSEPTFQNEWHCCTKHFCSDHMIKGWTWGWLCFFCITSQNIIKSPAVYSISTSKVSLLLEISSRVPVTAFEVYMLVWRVLWFHTVGASMFHWAFCLLSFFISKPGPLKPSPLLTIKDVPSPPPPTPPILSHDPQPLLMWDSYVTSQANQK